MRWYKIDLHIHTCLSPCAELDMTPRRIVKRAKEVGLDVIAICDHNASENVGASIRAGQQEGVVVLPGMEVCTKEEVHIICIFENLDELLKLQHEVNLNLPGENRPEVFGDQVIVNELDEVEGFSNRLLIGATMLSLEDVVSKVSEIGGVTIAAHVDKPSHSIISQLGFIPHGLALCGVEIWNWSDYPRLRTMKLGVERYPAIKCSDAHFLKDIGERFTRVSMDHASFQGVFKALKDTSKIMVGH